MPDQQDRDDWRITLDHRGEMTLFAKPLTPTSSMDLEPAIAVSRTDLMILCTVLQKAMVDENRRSRGGPADLQKWARLRDEYRRFIDEHGS